MPYEKITDLPSRARNVLPEHAQEIYLAAFNKAYDEYSGPNHRRDPEEELEAVCHKVAWAAVKQKYHKEAKGNWEEN